MGSNKWPPPPPRPPKKRIIREDIGSGIPSLDKIFTDLEKTLSELNYPSYDNGKEVNMRSFIDDELDKLDDELGFMDNEYEGLDWEDFDHTIKVDDPYGTEEAKRLLKEMEQYDTSTWGMLKDIWKSIWKEVMEEYVTKYPSSNNHLTSQEKQMKKMKKWIGKIILFMIGWILCSVVIHSCTNDEVKIDEQPSAIVTESSGIATIDNGKSIGGID